MTLKPEDGIKKVYSFDDAINLTGSGCYNLSLLATLSLSLLAMCLDLFSFSVIIPLCSCDFDLSLTQKSILVSIPFFGPILTAYIWGYVSDTKGRKFSLMLGMTISFIMSTSCAFSPNWIFLGLFKLVGTCFCSCAQSATFALLGESCPEKIKGKYLLILSSIVQQGIAVYFTLSYLTGFLDFSYDLGLITFVPWRLLVIILAMPLGISATLLLFFYESPKFLLNNDMETKAVDVLRTIHRRNGSPGGIYMVERVILEEAGNVTNKDIPLLKSLKEQTIPLYKPPLLYNTLLLYYLIIVPFGIGGSLYIWLPFIAGAFSGEPADFSEGLCSVIAERNTVSSHSETDVCKTIQLPLVITVLISSNVLCFLNALMSKLASRKRLLLLIIYTCASLCCFLTTLIPNKAAGFFYFGAIAMSLSFGPLLSYYVDLYPTSFRGMASCLGVMVARIGSILGINIVGPFITTKCSYTFYTLGAVTLSAACMALLLPPDRKKKTDLVE